MRSATAGYPAAQRPHVRRQARMAKPSIPKRVFAVIAVLVFGAFGLGVYFSTALVHGLAPYVFFGVGATRARHITIAEDHRHYILFSNGVAVHGLKLLPLELIWGVLSAVFVLGLFFASLRLVAFFVRRRDPALAD